MRPALGSDQPERELFIFTALNPRVFAHHRSYVYNTAKELNLLTDEQARTHDTYRSSIAFGGRIPGVFKCVELEELRFIDPRPQFFFHETRRGYVFSVKVAPEWWEKQSKKLNVSFQPDYSGEIVLARIPLGYFPHFLRNWEQAAFPRFFFNWQHRRQIKQLAASGWNVEDDDYGRIGHRYITVSIAKSEV